MHLDNHVEVLNDGTHTYHKGDYSASLDLTIVKGLQNSYPVKWTVLDDINFDHSPILTEVGAPGSGVVSLRKDWSNMDWNKSMKNSLLKFSWNYLLSGKLSRWIQTKRVNSYHKH